MIQNSLIDIKLFKILYESHPHTIYLLDKDFTIMWSSISYDSPTLPKLFSRKILPYMKKLDWEGFATYEADGFFSLITYAFQDSNLYYKVEIVNLQDAKLNALNRRACQACYNDWAYSILNQSLWELPRSIYYYSDMFLNYPYKAVEILRSRSMFIDYHCICEKNLIINYKEVDIKDYFHWFCESIGRITKNLKISFTYKNDFENNLYVLMDTQILTKILAHIVSNFIRFGANIPITMNTTYNKDRIIITVQGGGTLPFRAFETFYSSTVTNERCGNGLGLMLAKKMVHLLNGYISIEQLECGTIYSFTIPVPPRHKLSEHFYKVDLDKLLLLIMCDSFPVEDKNHFYLPLESKSM